MAADTMRAVGERGGLNRGRIDLRLFRYAVRCEGDGRGAPTVKARDGEDGEEERPCHNWGAHEELLSVLGALRSAEQQARGDGILGMTPCRPPICGVGTKYAGGEGRQRGRRGRTATGG